MDAWFQRWIVVAAAVVAQVAGAAELYAQTTVDSTSPAADVLDPTPTEGAGASADDLDTLLDLADRDIEQLGNVNVASNEEVSDVNPIVEGVSKKSETLAESPGIVDVITAKDIEAFGAKNLIEVLQRATSVFTTGSFLYPDNVAAIRGNLTSHVDNHVLILINGRPFRDVTRGGINIAVYKAFPLQTIERIEVIRGPGSVLYGTNAFSGVINIVTKNPDQPTFYASALAGSYGWQSYSLGGGAGDQTQGAYAGVTQSREKGWPFTATSEDPPGPAGRSTQTAPWGQDNVGAFAMYRREGLTANLFVARATEEMLGSIVTWPSERLIEPRVFANIGYEGEINDSQSLALNFTYNYDNTSFPVTFFNPANPQFSFAPAHSFLLEATYRAELGDNMDLLVGGLTDFHLGQVGSGPTAAVPQFSEIWYGVYAQLEYQTFEWLKLVGGMQANMPGVVRGGIVPRFGAIATLSDNWTGKFLYGQAFRSPYQVERSINVPGVLVGNPDLAPETIQTFDLQLAYRNEVFRFAATAFHSDYFDIVTRTGIPQTFENLGRMSFRGVELENRWEMTKRWQTLSSMTYQQNVRNGVDYTTQVPAWMAKMGVAYHDQRGLNVGLFDSFFGDQVVFPTAAPVNPDPQAYHLVSLNSTLDLERRLGWNSGPSMQLQFLIQNLFDEDINHAEFERELINSLPAGPGRTYYGGVTVSY